VSRRREVSIRTIVLLVALALSGAVDADAQVRRGRAQRDAAPTWAPISLGVRFGWDQRANGAVLGGQLRIPVIRSGIVELAPNAEMVFLNRTKEYQYNLEVAWVPGGVRGGLMLGGGIGWRDTVLGAIDPNEPRTTLFGYTIVVGARSNAGPVQFEVALRWVFLNDTTYRPNSVTLGLNYPLWRARPRGS
jgi:hypothetical protein